MFMRDCRSLCSRRHPDNTRAARITAGTDYIMTHCWLSVSFRQLLSVLFSLQCHGKSIVISRITITSIEAHVRFERVSTPSDMYVAVRLRTWRMNQIVRWSAGDQRISRMLTATNTQKHAVAFARDVQLKTHEFCDDRCAAQPRVTAPQPA